MRRAGKSLTVAGPHSDAAHAAITTELVRLTLGGKPDRPELMTTWEAPTPPARSGVSRLWDRLLRRWVSWVCSRNVRDPGPSDAWLERNPHVEV